MSATPTLISNVRNDGAQIQNADGTSFVSVVTPVAAGTRVKSIHASSTDTSAQVLQIAITKGGVDYVLGEVSVPAGSGTDGASSSVSLLNATKMPALQSDGISRWLDLATGSVLKIKSKTAVTSAKVIQIVAECGDFT